MSGKEPRSENVLLSSLGNIVKVDEQQRPGQPNQPRPRPPLELLDKVNVNYFKRNPAEGFLLSQWSDFFNGRGHTL